MSLGSLGSVKKEEAIDMSPDGFGPLTSTMPGPSMSSMVNNSGCGSGGGMSMGHSPNMMGINNSGGPPSIASNSGSGRGDKSP